MGLDFLKKKQFYNSSRKFDIFWRFVSLRSLKLKMNLIIIKKCDMLLLAPKTLTYYKLD